MYLIHRHPLFLLLLVFSFAQHIRSVCADPLTLTRHAILISAQNYPPQTGLAPLRFSANDISMMAKMLKEAGFADKNISVISDGQKIEAHQPFRNSIIEKVSQVTSELGANDFLLVALAGHGLFFDDAKESYFCPLDAKLDERQSLVSLSELYNQLDECKARGKFVLSDCCRNRAILPAKRGLVATPQNLTSEIQPTGSGVATLYSCGEGQYAYEANELRHGVFFYNVLCGLSGLADFDKDETISIPELELFTKKRVSHFVKLNFAATQTPSLHGSTEGLLAISSVPTKSALREALPHLNELSQEDEAKEKRVSFGAYLASVPRSNAGTLGVKPQNILIADVVPNSAFDIAGIQPGDVITKFDGQLVNDYVDFQSITKTIYDSKLTALQIPVEFKRNGKLLSATVTPQLISVDRKDPFFVDPNIRRRLLNNGCNGPLARAGNVLTASCTDAIGAWCMTASTTDRLNIPRYESISAVPVKGGEFICVSYADGLIKSFDSNTGLESEKFSFDMGEPAQLRVSADGSQLIALTTSGKLAQWIFTEKNKVKRKDFNLRDMFMSLKNQKYLLNAYYDKEKKSAAYFNKELVTGVERDNWTLSADGNLILFPYGGSILIADLKNEKARVILTKNLKLTGSSETAFSKGLLLKFVKISPGGNFITAGTLNNIFVIDLSTMTVNYVSERELSFAWVNFVSYLDERHFIASKPNERHNPLFAIYSVDNPSPIWTYFFRDEKTGIVQGRLRGIARGPAADEFTVSSNTYTSVYSFPHHLQSEIHSVKPLPKQADVAGMIPTLADVLASSLMPKIGRIEESWQEDSIEKLKYKKSFFKDNSFIKYSLGMLSSDREKVKLIAKFSNEPLTGYEEFSFTCNSDGLVVSDVNENAQFQGDSLEIGDIVVGLEVGHDEFGQGGVLRFPLDQTKESEAIRLRMLAGIQGTTMHLKVRKKPVDSVEGKVVDIELIRPEIGPWIKSSSIIGSKTTVKGTYSLSDERTVVIARNKLLPLPSEILLKDRFGKNLLGRLGILLDDRNENLVVFKVEEGSDAEAHGVKVGDELIAIEEEATGKVIRVITGRSLSQEALRSAQLGGDIGTRVKLHLRRNQQDESKLVIIACKRIQ